MALSADPAARNYTYTDLAGLPDDNLRREIIDGDLIVTPSPTPRHQTAVVNIVVGLADYHRAHGGRVFPAPLDVLLAEDNVVEPDVLFVRAERLDTIGDKYIRGAPDLVVEVSSPSTRRLELVRKLELYQRFGVPEYWYVDLEAERVETYVLAEDGSYDPPRILVAGDEISSARLPGFVIPTSRALGRD